MAAAGMSPDEVRTAIDQSDLAKPLGALIDAGALKIQRTAAVSRLRLSQMRTAQFTWLRRNSRPDPCGLPCCMRLSTTRVPPLIGNNAWSDLLGRLLSIYNQAKRSGGGARAVYDKALARMAHAQETSGPCRKI